MLFQASRLVTASSGMSRFISVSEYAPPSPSLLIPACIWVLGANSGANQLPKGWRHWVVGVGNAHVRRSDPVARCPSTGQIVTLEEAGRPTSPRYRRPNSSSRSGRLCPPLAGPFAPQAAACPMASRRELAPLTSHSPDRARVRNGGRDRCPDEWG
jgi:hypothetical protein